MIAIEIRGRQLATPEGAALLGKIQAALKGAAYKGEVVLDDLRSNAVNTEGTPITYLNVVVGKEHLPEGGSFSVRDNLTQRLSSLGLIIEVLVRDHQRSPLGKPQPK